jgi:isopentenyl-diphosphate delta-isomerase
LEQNSNISAEADLTPENRKEDHIDLALTPSSQSGWTDTRFDYEPMITACPTALEPFTFLGKQMRAPFWVSSMTGGTERAGEINRTLATVAGKFGMGMGLGSCRSLLYTDKHLSDFALRKFIGDDLPLFANLGIAQVEELVSQKQWPVIEELIRKIEGDGLIIHINPVQEWLQKGGDIIRWKPIDTIRQVLDHIGFPVIVKEVGQGIGPRSLKALMELPLAALEFGAHGGTNFGAIELLRYSGIEKASLEPLIHTGHTAVEMSGYIRNILDKNETLCRQFIISGGVKNFLDGYYCMQKIQAPAIIGQASNMLKQAVLGQESLEQYVEGQINGLRFARSYLKLRE